MEGQCIRDFHVLCATAVEAGWTKIKTAASQPDAAALFLNGNFAWAEPGLRSARALHFSDIVVPHRGILADVFRHHRDAFCQVQIDDIYAERSQPFDAAMKIQAVAHHQRAES